MCLSSSCPEGSCCWAVLFGGTQLMYATYTQVYFNKCFKVHAIKWCDSWWKKYQQSSLLATWSPPKAIYYEYYLLTERNIYFFLFKLRRVWTNFILTIYVCRHRIFKSCCTSSITPEIVILITQTQYQGIIRQRI